MLALYTDHHPEIGARASRGYLAAQEAGDTRLVLNHATSDAAGNLMAAAREAADAYSGLSSNSNVSNTAMAQAQVSGIITQGNLTAAMAQLMAFQAAKEAAEAYEQEIARRVALARFLQAEQEAQIEFDAQQAGIEARRASMQDGLLFTIPALYGGGQ